VSRLWFRFSLLDPTKLIERDLAVLAESSRYADLQFSKIERYIGSRVLELGAGIGTHTQRLVARQPELVIAVEQERRFCDEITRRAGSGVRVLCLDLAHLATAASELRRDRLDTIIALNVIEHVENDLACLAMAADLLVAGGHIIILAPAHPVLYAKLDRLYGHYRRYTRRMLLSYADHLGLQLIENTYFNMMGALGWLLLAKIGRATGLWREGMNLFDHMLPIQQRLERMLPVVPFGLGILGVFKRNQSVPT